MDGLSIKLQEVGAAKDDDLEGKANVEAVEELKRIFTTHKAILEKAKVKPWMTWPKLLESTIVTSRWACSGRTVVHTEVISL